MGIRSASCLILVIILSATINVSAEAIDDSVKIRYFNRFLSGALMGKREYGNAFSFSTSHGVRIGRLAAGLEVAYDKYTRWSTVPLSAVVLFDALRIKNVTTYVSVAGGFSLARKEQEDEYMDTDVTSAPTIYPALGIRLSSGNWNLYLQAGYKWQRINYTQSPKFFIDPPRNEIEEDIERLCIQIGIGWR
jgi:hypothetical protein